MMAKKAHSLSAARASGLEGVERTGHGSTVRRFLPIERLQVRPLLIVLAALLTAALGACLGGSSGAPHYSQEIDLQLRTLIVQQGLTGRPELIVAEEGRSIPTVDDPLVVLGKHLFFSKSLGGDFTSSCASCHHPLLAGGDALTLPIGVEAADPELLGPGRVQDVGAVGYDGGPNVPRNSPTTFNIVLYKQSLFWDGRVQRHSDGGIFTPDSLGPTASDPNAGPTLAAAQARFPVTSSEEMKSFTFEFGSPRSTVRDHLGARIGRYGVGAGEIPDDWLPLFREAFGAPTGSAVELIHYDTIALALAAYQESQFFAYNPWNRYVLGDLSALTAQQKRGALLFFRAPTYGGAGCSSCHAGDFFTDEDFHILAMPQVGRGKGDLNGSGAPTQDWGRARVTGATEDRFKFRTPSLLNVALSAPYGHSGAYNDLVDVLRHHLDPVAMNAIYNWTQTDPGTQVFDMIENTQEATTALLDARAAGQSRLPQNLDLSNDELAELLAFLAALTDPRLHAPAFLEPWIARNGAGFSDSQLLDAHFSD